jgi:hypothetical protein
MAPSGHPGFDDMKIAEICLEILTRVSVESSDVEKLLERRLNPVWPDLFLKGAQNVPKISQH